MRQLVHRWLGRYDADGLLRHTLVVMIFTHMGSVLNLVFHVVMGHALPAAEYGILASMLGVVLIVATPMVAVQNTLAHYAARARQEGQPGAVRSLVAQWFRRLAWIALPLAALGPLVGRRLAVFFQLESGLPIVLVFATCAGTILMMILPGVLQGLQSFVWMSMTVNAWGLARLLLGTLLVLTMGRLALWALAAQAASVLVTIAVGVAALEAVLRGAPSVPRAFPGAGRYFGLSLTGLLCFGFLMNADVVMVKHFFEPHRAGLFAQAATIARTVLFLSQPVVTALFPKVVSAGERSQEHQMTLWRAVGIAAAVIGTAALVCVLIPEVPLRVIYGQRSPSVEQVRLVRIVTLAMSPLGLTYLLLNFELAQHRFALIVPLAVCALAYVAGVFFWHATFGQVAAVLAAVSMASALGLLICLPRRGVAEDPQTIP